MPRSKNKAAPAMSCTGHDCANNKHCFRPEHLDDDPGPCIGCGTTPVDFERVHRLSLDDIAYTLTAMRNEQIREEFWRRALNVRSVNYARRKGMDALLEGAAHKVIMNVGETPDSFDGRRVPVADGRLANPYQYAFHATATCCRKCMRYWHGIPRDRPLTPAEVNYFAELVREFLRQRLPELPAEGEKVPVLHLTDV